MPDHPPFSVELHPDDAHPVLTVRGELDVATAPAVREALLGLLTRDPLPDVTVDLSAVTFLDSSGLGVLLMAARRWESAQRALVLHRPSPIAARVIELTGAMRAFTIEE